MNKDAVASKGVLFLVGSPSILKKIESPASAQNLNKSRSPVVPPTEIVPEKNIPVAEFALANMVPLGSVSAIAEEAPRPEPGG